ncbi:MAG: transcriptional regulator [Solirubrobacterales bacterium]|nr:transcriptional regulator [Solirubrobacterales bacterium]MBV9047813.1 transcriptional regulator [Solirubrobacterales bacterium]
MSSKRTYGDRCGIARALDLIGERWALLIVRELLLGPKRFTDLRAGLPHLGPDVLSQRLRELGRSGIIQRRKLPPPAASQIYELTAWGRELEPVVLGLGRWGSRTPTSDEHSVFGADSAVLALKTLFDPAAAAALDARYELRLGEQRFALRIRGGTLETSRGEVEHPDAIIETDPATLAGVLWHGRSLARAERSGALALRGDRAAARRFLDLFPLPEPSPDTQVAD